MASISSTALARSTGAAASAAGAGAGPASDAGIIDDTPLAAGGVDDAGVEVDAAQALSFRLLARRGGKAQPARIDPDRVEVERRSVVAGTCDRKLGIGSRRHHGQVGDDQDLVAIQETFFHIIGDMEEKAVQLTNIIQTRRNAERAAAAGGAA